MRTRSRRPSRARADSFMSLLSFAAHQERIALDDVHDQLAQVAGGHEALLDGLERAGVVARRLARHAVHEELAREALAYVLTLSQALEQLAALVERTVEIGAERELSRGVDGRAVEHATEAAD